MKTFITGATGYIGNHLALRLAGEGHFIHALIRNPDKMESLQHPNIKLFKGDVNDMESIKKGMEGCERVFHLAAFARLWARPSDIFYKINVEGTKNVLDAAVEKNISRLVYTSSTAVFGNSMNQPMCENDPRTIGFDNDYDLSKCMAEKLVIEYAKGGLHALIVNPSRVYGPGNETFSNPFTRLVKALMKGKIISVPNCSDVVANYTYVHDVVEGHILAMERGKAGERYILGGENISYGQLLDLIREMFPSRKVFLAPKVIFKTAAAMQLFRFYLTKQQPAVTPSMVERFYANTAFSCQKAIEELNYHITPFRKGILDTIHHLKQQ